MDKSKANFTGSFFLLLYDKCSNTHTHMDSAIIR